MRCRLLDVPVSDGAGQAGCERGPGALRAAGLATSLRRGGRSVEDGGVVCPAGSRPMFHGNLALKALPQVSAWTTALAEAAFTASADGIPVFLGGDHSLSAGTISGLARRAQTEQRPLFVLWLDAHPDFHTLETSESGNLHGVPLAYATGLPGFAGYFPALDARVDASRICMLGVRSVDAAERSALAGAGVVMHGMAAIRREGVAALLVPFLEQVASENGRLHVSLDVDFLDPSIAPAVGTQVAGGATLQEAQAVADCIGASGLASSLDLVELNPRLDEDNGFAGRTAAVMVDLAGRLLNAPRTLNFASTQGCA